MKKLLVLVYFILSPISIFSQMYGYEIKIGEKYNILQYNANIREEPTIDSNVIAILSINDEIVILENTRIEEIINNVYGLWYKIKYGNIIGYTFGGNIASKTFITDIDNNGINDYFYFRYSIKKTSSSLSWWVFDSHIDIFIYINNKRIKTDSLNEYSPRGITNDHIFDWCEFVAYDEFVNIELIKYAKDNYEFITVYQIDSNGIIRFLERRVN